jgi:hypothetical protein
MQNVMPQGGRKLMKSIIIMLALILCTGIVLAGDVGIQRNFHAEILKTYDFQPHTLSQKEIEAKSNDLDQFWNKVKNRKEQYLPLLRAELQAPSNPSFFYYDCSKLLLSLSENIDDRKIALKAIPKVDLLDVQHDDYLSTIHMLARNELDTSDAALRILDYPQFKAIIPQHALTLGQDFSLIYMLIPTKEEYYIQKLIKRLSEEKNIASQKSIIQVLWYTVTKRGDQAIQQFSEDSSKPNESRMWAKELLGGKSKLGLTSKLTVSSYSSLKQKRKEVMSRISDEALIEFDQLTAKMLVKRKE